MTQQEIIEMAREAYISTTWPASERALICFAKLVAAKEREACAKVCEVIGNTQANMSLAWRNGCRDSAAEIRARGEQA